MNQHVSRYGRLRTMSKKVEDVVYDALLSSSKMTREQSFFKRRMYDDSLKIYYLVAF